MWASTLGGRVLGQAKQQGLEVPQDALDKLTTWLATEVRRYNNLGGESTNAAAAVHTLVLLGKPDKAYMSRLFDLRKDLTVQARLSLALAMLDSGGKADLVKTLLETPEPAVDVNRGWYWLGNHHIPAMNLAVWWRLEPTGEPCQKALDNLLQKRNRGHWYTTFANSWGLSALTDYARKAEKAATAQVLLTGAISQTLDIRDGKLQQAGWKRQNNPAEALTAQLAENSGQTFVRLTVTSAPKITPVPPLATKMSVNRQYRKLLPNGTTTELGEPQVGDLVLVNLTFTAPDDQHYLVLDDALPSGLETVFQDSKTQRAALPALDNQRYKAWTVDHQELRDDRAVFF